MKVPPDYLRGAFYPEGQSLRGAFYPAGQSLRLTSPLFLDAKHLYESLMYVIMSVTNCPFSKVEQMLPIWSQGNTKKDVWMKMSNLSKSTKKSLKKSTKKSLKTISKNLSKYFQKFLKIFCKIKFQTNFKIFSEKIT